MNNFTVIDIPYWNELQAGAVGSSAVFEASTPASHLENSLENLLNWLTRGNQRRVSGFQDRIQSGREWERIMRENEASQRQPGDSTRRYPATPPINPETNQNESLIDRILREPLLKDQVENTNPKTACGSFDFPCQFEEILTSDSVKRLGLIILAVLLIIVAVVSFR